jgi:FtsH-binding integral membrane protein
MIIQDLLLAIGVKPADFVAGLAGGMVNALVFRRSNPVAIVSSMVVGALTASYLSDTFAHYAGTSGGASAFIVGLAAMAICQGIVEAVSKWRPKGE